MQRMCALWQPVLTSHQSHTLDALALCTDWQVRAIVVKEEDETRRSQGWTQAVCSVASMEVMPHAGWLGFSINVLRRSPNDIHLFGSPFENPRLMFVMFVALAIGKKVYLISEPYSPISSGYFDERDSLRTYMKAKFRPLIYKAYGSLIRRRAEGVFAISSLAIAQFVAMGIPSIRVFPFGYFVPKQTGLPRQAPQTGQTLRLVYVGLLIRRKGFDIAASAVSRLLAAGIAITLDCYGPCEGAFAEEFVEPAIRYLGPLPFGQAPITMAMYDALIVPSRHDGWGVVVNEGIQAGVPVICSENVGAKTLVSTFGCGVIFDSNSVDTLCAEIMKIATHPELLLKMREATIEAGRALEPEIAAEYLALAITDTEAGKPCPRSPWYLPRGLGQA